VCRGAPSGRFTPTYEPVTVSIILGIDVGGSGTKGAPIDITTGRMTGERHRVPTPQPATPESIAQTIRLLTDHFSWTGPLGVAFPARIKNGRAMTASNIDATWIGTDTETLFAKATGCTTTVINDADAAGQAEVAFGAARGQRGVVMMLTFGTGIGTALFVDGRLVPNIEMGHLEIRGRNAESYAADRVRKSEDLTWPQWAERVQEYLDTIDFLVAPDLIVIGGGVSKPNKTPKYLHLLRSQAELRPAMHHNDSGIIGAAYAASLSHVPA
jgi:polyphosphate glucokinase